MGCRTSLAIGGMAAAFLHVGARDAAADDYFKGKDITIFVGSTAGGPYDAYARMLARHWGRNIPGNPNLVVQNMPGASGRRLMGHMQGIAPKDGTAIAAGHRALAVRSADGREGQVRSHQGDLDRQRQ